MRDLVNKIKLIKEGGWLIAGQVLTLTASLMAVQVFTNHLEPSQYGELALGLTIATLANQMVFGALINGIARFFSIAVEKRELGDYFFATYQIVIKGALITLGLGALGVLLFFMLGCSHWGMIALAAVIFSVLSGLGSIISSIQNSAQQRMKVALFNGADAWLRIALALGCFTFINASAVTVMICYIGSTFIITWIQFFSLRKSFVSEFMGGESVEKKWEKKILGYSKPFLIWGGFTWLQLSSDRWALEWFSSANEVGLYNALYQIGYAPISLGTALIMSYITPILFKYSGNSIDMHKSKRVGQSILKILILITILAGVGVMLTTIYHQQIFSSFVNSRYQSVSNLMPWMVASGAMFAGGQIMSLQFLIAKRPEMMTKVKIVTALIGFILNIVGAYYFGMTGVVAAIFIFSLIYMVWSIYLMYSEDRIMLNALF